MESTPSRTIVTDTTANVFNVNGLRESIDALQTKVEELQPKLDALAAVFANDPKVLNIAKASLLADVRSIAKNLHDFAMNHLSAIDSTDLGDIVKLRFDETTRRTRKVTPKDKAEKNQ